MPIHFGPLDLFWGLFTTTPYISQWSLCISLHI